MADKLLIQEIDALTNESTVRPFTEEEVATYEATNAEADAIKAEKEAARTSALAKLAALGLTEEEVAAL